MDIHGNIAHQSGYVNQRMRMFHKKGVSPRNLLKIIHEKENEPHKRFRVYE